ncbi:MAG TPA: hypothetical protein VIM65_01255 [Cyclobacteriaceae bacterium]
MKILFFLLALATSIVSQAQSNMFNMVREKTSFPSIKTGEVLKDSARPDPTVTKKGLDTTILSYNISLIKAKKAAREKEIREKYKVLIDDAIKQYNSASTNEDIVTSGDALASLNDKMQSEIDEADEIFKAQQEEMNFKKRSGRFVFFLSKNHWVANAYDAKVYYDKSSTQKTSRFLNNSLLSYSATGEKVSIYNEIYSDYLGPIRFAFGALISNKSSVKDTVETQKDAFQRLLGGGGNAVVTLSYPLFGSISKNKRLNIKVTAAPKLSFDVPTIGTEKNKAATNLDAAVEATVFYSGLSDIVTLFGNARVGEVYGNCNFYSNLNKDYGSFAFMQFSFGAALNSTFRISYNIYSGSTFVIDNFPQAISLAFIPQQK